MSEPCENATGRGDRAGLGETGDMGSPPTLVAESGSLADVSAGDASDEACDEESGNGAGTVKPCRR